MSEPEASIDVDILREPEDQEEGPEDATQVDEGAFAQAAGIQDAQPITDLRPRWRRRPRATVELQPAEREARKATLKLRAREQDVGLKRLMAWVAISAVILQLLVADAFLAHYVLLATPNPSDTVLIAWLSASVVEVIGIVAIVARNLFPDRTKRKSDQARPKQKKRRRSG
ncbi:hypothetical protein [Plantibacter sp. PA-3-X8]|uniref:hypothetical protein n=1 Tax=Plantibacter sp. PA-3-X8 TaxID=2480625 RepID=UPI000F5E4A8B|nr:hypothetical protein [Plantibacter sp. PA-3-X8]